MRIFKNCNLFLFMFWIITTFSFGQCGNIELSSQEEVNNFIKKYGYCKTVQNLKIFDSKNDLVQFDSLYQLERIEGRFDLQVITDSKKKLIGFRNLKFINDFHLNVSNISDVFISLDTINHLNIRADSTGYKALNGVRYIKNSLRFSPIDYCLTNYLVNFATDFNFSLIIGFEENTSLNCFDRLSNNIDTKKLKKLQFIAGNHDLSKLSFIDSLETLILAASSFIAKSDFSAVKKLTNLKHVEISWDRGINNFGEGFKLTYGLDSMILNNNKAIKNYKNLFPNIKTIRKYLSVNGNDALINLEFLKDVLLPNDSSDSISISIQDNKLLNDCNVTFLCEALSNYPNVVIIENNGAKCTKEEILKYCATVNTVEEGRTKLVLVPNPTFGYVRIENVSQPISVKISNMSGKVVKTMSDIQNEINIDDLPAGMYIFDIRNKNFSERHKIVKVE